MSKVIKIKAEELNMTVFQIAANVHDMNNGKVVLGLATSYVQKTLPVCPAGQAGNQISLAPRDRFGFGLEQTEEEDSYFKLLCNICKITRYIITDGIFSIK